MKSYTYEEGKIFLSHRLVTQNYISNKITLLLLYLYIFFYIYLLLYLYFYVTYVTYIIIIIIIYRESLNLGISNSYKNCYFFIKNICYNTKKTCNYIKKCIFSLKKCQKKCVFLVFFLCFLSDFF